MKNVISFIIIIFIFSLQPVSALADVVSDTLQGQDLLFQRDYPAAIKVFQEIEKKYPESPAGAFGQLAAYQVHMYENQDFRFMGQYNEAEKRFERAASKVLQTKASPFDLFVIGAGYGMRGFYYARANKWFRGLGSAVRAIQILKRAKFEYPDFPDPNMGIGMYNYWRSVFTKSFSFLPFFADHREEGIGQVKDVLEHGLYAKQLAEANLAFIYGQEDNYREARKYIDDLLARYPDNIVMLKFSARLYGWMKDFDKSAKEFNKILTIDPSVTKTYFYMGVALMKKPGGTKESLACFEKYLTTNPEKNWAEMAKRHMAALEQRKQASLSDSTKVDLLTLFKAE